MNYIEFKNEYKEAVKAYPDLTNLHNDNEENKEISLTCKRYIKSGSKWTQTESKTQAINYLHYANIIDPSASKFFRNLGGYERIKKNYTRRGYLPIEVISISPDRTKKTVYSFTF